MSTFLRRLQRPHEKHSWPRQVVGEESRPRLRQLRMKALPASYGRQRIASRPPLPRRRCNTLTEHHPHEQMLYRGQLWQPEWRVARPRNERFWNKAKVSIEPVWHRGWTLWCLWSPAWSREKAVRFAMRRERRPLRKSLLLLLPPSPTLSLAQDLPTRHKSAHLLQPNRT